MKVWRMLGCVICFVALGGPIPLVAQTPGQDFEVRLRRTTCFGSCPYYNVTIKGDGTVTYEGKEYVRVKGKKTTKIAPSEVQKLAAEMVEAGYFSFQDNYVEIKNPDGTVTTVTDLPTTYTYLRVGHKTKEVEDYVGAPKELKTLERRIDEVAGTRRWVFVDGPTVRDMAHHGWNVKSREADSFLVAAAQSGYDDVVQALIEVGANPDAPTSSESPLQVARRASTVQLLIKAGADVNAKVRGDYGHTPLQFAAHYGEPQSLSLLINAGADFNYVDKYGETVLMYAVRSGSAAKVKLLLDAGANANAELNGKSTQKGKTALHIAEELQVEHSSRRLPAELFDDGPSEYEEIIKLLKATGAKGR